MHAYMYYVCMYVYFALEPTGKPVKKLFQRKNKNKT